MQINITTKPLAAIISPATVENRLGVNRFCAGKDNWKKSKAAKERVEKTV